jgi:hypothetical protein
MIQKSNEMKSPATTKTMANTEAVSPDLATTVANAVNKKPIPIRKKFTRWNRRSISVFGVIRGQVLILGVLPQDSRTL